MRSVAPVDFLTQDLHAMNGARVKTFKETNVGPIPNDWHVAALGDIAVTSSGTTPARALTERYYRNGSVNWVKTLDLNDSEIATTEEKVTRIAIEETALRAYPAGTVLVAMYGGFNQIGRTGLLRIPAAVNQAITAIQAMPSRICPEYLLATLNFKVNYWKTVASSSRKDPNITSLDVRAFPVALPPLAEQEAIAAALSEVDSLLARLDALVAKKHDLKRAAMQQLLTGQTRLPGFDGEWAVQRLGELGHFLKGRGIRKDEALSGHLACIRYGEIYTQHDDCIKAYHSWISKDVARTAVSLRRGDLLFAGSGETKQEIGKCAAFLDHIEAYAGGDIIILRPYASDSVFMGYYLNTQMINAQKASRGQGDAVVHISASALSTIEVIVPQPNEQAAIGAVLSEIDAEIAALEARRNKARALKQGMMHELLTGRIRLI